MFGCIEKLCFIIYVLHRFCYSQCKFVGEVCKLITWNKAYWTGEFAVESTNKRYGASVGESYGYLMRFMSMGGDEDHNDSLFFIIG